MSVQKGPMPENVKKIERVRARIEAGEKVRLALDAEGLDASTWYKYNPPKGSGRKPGDRYQSRATRVAKPAHFPVVAAPSVKAKPPKRPEPTPIMGRVAVLIGAPLDVLQLMKGLTYAN
jgi:hypothetical protein